MEKSIWEKRVEEDTSTKGLDHAIELKERFVPKKGKVYSLLRKKREEV